MLKDTAIRNAKPREKPYKLAGGGGLYLLVHPAGVRGASDKGNPAEHDAEERRALRVERSALGSCDWSGPSVT